MCQPNRPRFSVVVVDWLYICPHYSSRLEHDLRTWNRLKRAP